MTQIASARAYARAALLGNPSDLHDGAVLAFTFEDFRAEAMVGGDGEAGGALTDAALATLADHLGDPAAGSLAVSCRTTIPREVGLGGSSAIVIATMRAACESLGVSIGPDELAALALRAETDRLGIAAGPQDRVVQAHEGLLLMDFAGGSVERIDQAVLPPLFIAWLEGAGEDSGRAHAEVYGRLRGGARGVRDVMAAIAELARRGADALHAGDLTAFGTLMVRNLDLRRRVYELDPRHLRMAEVAREHGAPANYAGSGGAIVGVAPAGTRFEPMREALEAEGCRVIRPRVATGPLGSAS